MVGEGLAMAAFHLEDPGYELGVSGAADLDHIVELCDGHHLRRDCLMNFTTHKMKH